jgi:diguanylate cyclase (GGDEF)-like protein/PAS domain S-box-containing protein
MHGRLSGQTSVQLTRRLTAADGSFGGLIVAALDIPRIESFYSSIDLGAGGVISLVGTDGILRARGGRDPKADSFVGRSVGQSPLFSLLRQSASGSYWNTSNPAGTLDGVSRLISYHVVDGFPLIAVVGLTEDDIFASANADTHKYYAIASLLTLAVMVATIIGAIRRHKLSLTMTALEQSKSSLEKTNVRFDTALENMMHGLCMFDAAGRLVVCNRRYRDMYRLPPDLPQPGRPVLALVQYRSATDTFTGNPEDYVREILTAMACGKSMTKEVTTGDGRIVQVRNQPMPGGGWVATHEDVTEAKQKEASFRLLFESSPVAMWVFDRDSLQFLAVNQAAITQYGYSHEQFMAMRVLDVRPPEDRTKLEQFLRALPEVQRDEKLGRHLKADGTMMIVTVFSQTLTYQNHRARLVALLDVTKQRLTEDELRRTRKFLDTVIDSVPLPISVKDVRGAPADAAQSRFTLVNSAYERQLGDPRSQLIGKTLHEAYPKEQADRIIASDNATLQSDQAEMVREYVVETPRGPRTMTAMKAAVRDDDGHPQYLLTVLEDVTDRRRVEQRIARMAHHDPLTDLPNRAAFSEHLSATLAKATANNLQFAILSVDFDRFKEVNDVFGHAVGDSLLCQIAKRLQTVAGEAFIARLGGDEFSFIVEGAQPAAASRLAERLLATMTEDVEVGGLKLRVGLSIGAAVYPTDSIDLGRLMSNADAALYRAKAEARGTLRFFESEMDTRLRDRLALQNDLRIAIDRDELRLDFQPQVLIAGETVGFDALVRWQCPKRGLVPPKTFIPIAEDSSLIISVGEWVLRQACREAASWPEPLRVAVNVSPIQFRYGDLPRLVHAVLLETGLSPDRLELEITESVMISDFTRAVSLLRRLKTLGVGIAMDDFGTGYSSLSFLQSFPCDRIKIDASFVRDLEASLHSQAIVRAVIGLGRSLNTPTLAEGVETEAQRAWLGQEGCDEVQGYLTGRPLPIEQYAEITGKQVPTAKQKAS